METGSSWSLVRVIAMAAMLAACATTSEKPKPPPPPPPPPPPALAAPAELAAPVAPHTAEVPPASQVQPGSNPQQALSFQAVRYIGVDSGNWTVPDGQTNFSGLYTRIVVQGNQALGAGPSGQGSTPEFRSYRLEDRGWFARLLASRKRGATLVANVSTTNPSLKIAIPLFSESYSSDDKSGNIWSTSIDSSYAASPLFLIAPNTALTISLDANVSSMFQSQAASLAIGAITKAVNIAAPSSTIFTTLSKNNINNTANAIDTAVSGLLSNQITEEISLGRLSNSWQPGSSIILYGCVPFMRFDGAEGGQPKCAQSVDLDGTHNAFIGTWTFQLACPRPSAFDPRDICSTLNASDTDLTVSQSQKVLIVSNAMVRKKIWQAIAPSVSDADVLNFELANNTTIASYVQTQSWYTDFISNPVATTSDLIDNQTGNLCANAVVALQGVGLNQLDATLALRAMINQLPKIVARRGDFAGATTTGKTCAAVFGEVFVTLDSGSVPPPVSGAPAAAHGGGAGKSGGT